MRTREDFLWGGLRARLERSGKVRPRTLHQDVVGQRPEPVHRQVRFRPVRPALRPRLAQLQAVQGARGR